MQQNFSWVLKYVKLMFLAIDLDSKSKQGGRPLRDIKTKTKKLKTILKCTGGQWINV